MTMEMEMEMAMAMAMAIGQSDVVHPVLYRSIVTLTIVAATDSKR